MKKEELRKKIYGIINIEHSKVGEIMKAFDDYIITSMKQLYGDDYKRFDTDGNDLKNKMEREREQLIDICERAIVLQKDWGDRDSESAQQNIGRVWQLLKCGCEYEITTKDNCERDSTCVTDEKTIWIKFRVHDFMWFEYGGEESDKGSDTDTSGQLLNFYLPTDKRLKESNGRDWY